MFSLYPQNPVNFFLQLFFTHRLNIGGLLFLFEAALLLCVFNAIDPKLNSHGCTPCLLLSPLKAWSRKKEWHCTASEETSNTQLFLQTGNI